MELSYFFLYFGKKYNSGSRYWNVPVLVNTGTSQYWWILERPSIGEYWNIPVLVNIGTSQHWWILEHLSIGEYWKIFGVLVLTGNVIFTFFRIYRCYSEAYNTGKQKWSSIVQYSCTSIWDLKYTFPLFLQLLSNLTDQAQCSK